MSIIVMQITDLSILASLARSADIVSKSTNNPNVPGNASILAALVTAQDGLQAAEAALESHKTALKALKQARDVAYDTWKASLSNLAAFTETVTEGNAEKILTTGFFVRGVPVPPQPLEAPINLRAAYTGKQGYTKLTWKPVRGAVSYIIECSMDPTDAASWKNVGVSTKARFTGNGATAGQPCWYRVCAVNALGQGNWSEPALRPVM